MSKERQIDDGRTPTPEIEASDANLGWPEVAETTGARPLLVGGGAESR